MERNIKEGEKKRQTLRVKIYWKKLFSVSCWDFQVRTFYCIKGWKKERKKEKQKEKLNNRSNEVEKRTNYKRVEKVIMTVQKKTFFLCRLLNISPSSTKRLQIKCKQRKFKFKFDRLGRKSTGIPEKEMKIYFKIQQNCKFHLLFLWTKWSEFLRQIRCTYTNSFKS
jgi:hypothetical protein